MFLKLSIVLFGLVLTIVLSEEINKDLKLKDHSDVVFPADTPKASNNESILNTESLAGSEDEDKPMPRESKGIKYYSIPVQNYQSRSANPVEDNYENDDYDEGIIGDEDVEDDYDYKSLARNAPINQVVNNRNINQINDNRGISIGMNENMKSTSDNPRIISIRDGFNLFRNFWRNRNEDKNKEALPVITLTTTPTTGALTTMEQEQNFDYGTPTGTATGTGTITAISPDEIEQNNAAVQAIETPSPFFSFTRKSNPVQYEIIEEYPLEGNDSNVLSFSGDYIDITSDELEPNDESKSSKPKMPSVVRQKISGHNQQTEQHLQQDSLPKRKNTKLKVLTEPIAEIDPVEKPKVTQEVKKTGLDYYRQYLPNLQKLIEIRPKFFLNRLLPGSKKEVNDIGTQRNVQQRNVQQTNFQQRKSPSRRKSNQRIIKRKKSVTPKIVNYVNTDQLSQTNRLPVKRVAFYVV